jgi:hypothetical protein
MFKKLLVVAITSAALMSGSLLAGAPAQAHPGKPKPPKPYPASVVTHCHAKMKYYKVHRGQFPKVDVWVTSGVSKRIKGTVKVSVGHKVTYKNYNGHAKRIWLTKRLGLGKYLVYVQFLPKTHSIFKRCSTTTAFKVVRWKHHSKHHHHSSV